MGRAAGEGASLATAAEIVRVRGKSIELWSKQREIPLISSIFLNHFRRISPCSHITLIRSTSVLPDKLFYNLFLQRETRRLHRTLHHFHPRKDIPLSGSSLAPQKNRLYSKTRFTISSFYSKHNLQLFSAYEDRILGSIHLGEIPTHRRNSWWNKFAEICFFCENLGWFCKMAAFQISKGWIWIWIRARFYCAVAFVFNHFFVISLFC